MSRKGSVSPRQVLPDPTYGSRIVTKLINRIMYDGKKSIARSQVYGAFQKIQQETKENPLSVFLSVIEKIKPTMEVRPRRVGGAAYQVPIPVRGSRRESLAIRWLIQGTHKRSNSQYHTLADKLAAEIVDAYRGEGAAVAKKREVERTAEANKAFAHFRW